MAAVTITIEDAADNSVGIHVAFAPGVSVNEPTKTPAQQLASHVLKWLKAVGKGEVDENTRFADVLSKFTSKTTTG